MNLLSNPVIKRGLTICGIAVLIAVVAIAWAQYSEAPTAPAGTQAVAATTVPEPVAPVQYPPATTAVSGKATAIPTGYSASHAQASTHNRSYERNHNNSHGYAARSNDARNYQHHHSHRKAKIIGGSAAGGALIGGLAGGGKGLLIGGALGAGGGYLYNKFHHHHH